MLKQKFQEELKQSMLAKDEFKTSVLRLLISSINYFEIQKGIGYEAADEDVISIIQREIKQRNDSIEQYNKGNRRDLAEKEEKELQFLQTYLPEQMSEKEIRKLVDEAISQTGAKATNEMGKVMAALMPKVKGKADGSLVSKIVIEKLS